MPPPEIFWKAICDFVPFDNARHILYHLKINIAVAAITPANPFSAALTTVPLVIILSVVNAEWKPFSELILKYQQFQLLLFQLLLFQLFTTKHVICLIIMRVRFRFFPYWESTFVNLSVASRRTKFNWEIMKFWKSICEHFFKMFIVTVTHWFWPTETD